MNIRGLTQIPSVTEQPVNAVDKVTAATSQIKSDTAHDRDANGQQFYQRQQKKKEKMSQEVFAKAIAALKEKSFIKDMNWTVSAGDENGIKYAYIHDAEGQLIRRIMEGDLWEVFDEPQSAQGRGQLLNKSA